MNTAEKNTALFGGKILSVVFEDGSNAQIKVRQLRLADYDTAYGYIDDEFALAAFCCVPPEADPKTPAPRSWIETLTPESYELIWTTVQEVNAKGFFSYSARRTQRVALRQREMFAAMSELPPETLKTAMELGKSALPTRSPVPRPMPG